LNSTFIIKMFIKFILAFLVCCSLVITINACQCTGWDSQVCKGLYCGQSLVDVSCKKNSIYQCNGKGKCKLLGPCTKGCIKNSNGDYCKK
jgi:hypothetical protein